MIRKLEPIFTRRFVMFGAVGASGVLVNLGFLFVFADLLEVQANVASALAIELSILSNFLLNDRWTFRDRRRADKPASRRVFDFHVVSLVGALMQFAMFVVGNVVFGHYFGDGGGHALLDPPEVGPLKYVSQLLGIGVAVLWNYLANFNLTWRTDTKS